jgi:nucleoside-triphosphatase THEP1
LSSVNKQEAITNLLLGKDPINAFKYIGKDGSWNIDKDTQKLLGVPLTHPMFNVSKRNTNKFIDELVAIKKQLGGYSVNDLKVYKKELEDKFNKHINQAMRVYSDGVLKTAMNSGRYNNVVNAIKTSNTEVDTSAVDLIGKLINEESDINKLIEKVNDAAKLLPDTLPESIHKKLKNFVDVIEKRRSDQIAESPVNLDNLVK